MYKVICLVYPPLRYYLTSASSYVRRNKERNPLQKGHMKDISSIVCETILSLSPISGGKITNKEVLVTRHGVRAAYSWPRVIPKTAHLLRRVACTRTRITPFATLRSYTTAPLPAAAIRGCAAVVDVAPLAMGVTVGSV
jgi:hypothetical protein